jgi:hypothetical protein
MYNEEFKLLTEKQGFQNFGLVTNAYVLNNLNYTHRFTYNLGNCFVEKSFFPFCIGLSSAAFLMFKKPFNFKSKKKKK